MENKNYFTSASAWNFIGLLVGALSVNTLLALMLFIFGIFESWGFKLPSGKGNDHEYDTGITQILSALLLLVNLCIFFRMGFKSRSSKCFGYAVGAVLPLGIVGYWLFTAKLPF